MKKTRRRYDREFKISVVAELESGKPVAQISASMGFIQVSHPGGEMSWLKIPKWHLAATETSTRIRLE